MPPVFAAIDLKSFYASVECVERGWNPLETHLVVADAARTEKTICLAVSPPLKAFGISGRARLFEVIQRVEEVNRERRQGRRRPPTGEARTTAELAADPDSLLGFHIAPPRMALYVEYSTRIYEVYLRHVAAEHLHVYSIDEVMIDLTPYLASGTETAASFVSRMIREVYEETGITATGGIGTNLYLAKVAMDILAKHARPDEHGVRLAELDERSYRRLLWAHRPLTDFWRVGRGIAAKLEAHGMLTMGDVARRSLRFEESLYRLFGVNAELLIDHAWGWEPCTMQAIKAYRPSSNSLCSGQVLECPYSAEKGLLVAKEMADQLALDLVDKGMKTTLVTLDVGYDRESLENPAVSYSGPVVTDRYGRMVPKPAHGTAGFARATSSARRIAMAIRAIYEQEVNPELSIRRLTVSACELVPAAEADAEPQQLELFTPQETRQRRDEMLEREHRAQEAMLDIKRRFGKNAILKGMNLEEGATMTKRNGQIGGHKA